MLGTCCSIHSAYIQFVVSERLVGSEETSRLTNLQTAVTHKLQIRPINSHHFMTQSGATMHSKPCMVTIISIGNRPCIGYNFGGRVQPCMEWGHLRSGNRNFFDGIVTSHTYDNIAEKYTLKFISLFKKKKATKKYTDYFKISCTFVKYSNLKKCNMKNNI